MERIAGGSPPPQQNVEVVLRHLDALSRTDLDAVMATYHPEAELDVSPFGFERADGAIQTGSRAIRQAFEGVLDTWAEVRVEPRRMIDAGGQVMVLFHFWGRTRSGIELEQDGAEVSTVLSGRIVRDVIYPNAAAALRAFAEAA